MPMLATGSVNGIIDAIDRENVLYLTKFPKVGDKFDSRTMNAVDTEEGEKENLVLKVYGNGYKLHDRIVRPAMVQVSVRKVDNKENEEVSEPKCDA